MMFNLPKPHLQHVRHPCVGFITESKSETIRFLPITAHGGASKSVLKSISRSCVSVWVDLRSEPSIIGKSNMR